MPFDAYYIHVGKNLCETVHKVAQFDTISYRETVLHKTSFMEVEESIDCATISVMFEYILFVKQQKINTSFAASIISFCL